MSWESSAVYYQLLNKKVNELFGNYTSCKCILNSIDFGVVEPLVKANDWKSIDEILSKEALNIEKAGADFIIVASNTAHLCYEAIVKVINIPLLHIADATGVAASDLGLKKVALLGTLYTMEKDFYKGFIHMNYDIEVIVPEDSHKIIINDIIFNELIKGQINNQSRQTILEIIEKQVSRGAEGIILGCTEIPLLISQNDIPIPVFDTTLLHVEMALEYALLA